ncbi:MAG: cellulose binding domain-containing protein, partial [Micromonosporaceae bacterium]|nr:cellulose binding domain-containing protein [Micromonosporaceae bacterium]
PTPTASPTPTSSTPAPATCRVSYAVNDWGNGGGFGGAISITNTGTAPVNGWTLRFTFPGNQQVTQGWNATWSQQGQAVSAVNLPWNATLAPNASVSIGFNGSYSGTNPQPTAFSLNNIPCAVT